MRFCCRFTVVACLLFTAAAAVAHEKWDFHDADAGRFPKGWIAGVTGSKAGTAPRWKYSAMKATRFSPNWNPAVPEVTFPCA